MPVKLPREKGAPWLQRFYLLAELFLGLKLEKKRVLKGRCGCYDLFCGKCCICCETCWE